MALKMAGSEGKWLVEFYEESALEFGDAITGGLGEFATGMQVTSS